jgi:hypothetical protein
MVMTRTQPDGSTARPTMLLVGWAASVVPLGDVDGIEARTCEVDPADPVVVRPTSPTRA